jgi:hypothetical protein
VGIRPHDPELAPTQKRRTSPIGGLSALQETFEGGARPAAAGVGRAADLAAVEQAAAR